MFDGMMVGLAKGVLISAAVLSVWWVGGTAIERGVVLLKGRR